MMFTFLMAVAVGQSFGMRPMYTSLTNSANFARLGDIAKTVRSHPSNSMESIQSVAGIVNSMLQEGQAPDHIDDESRTLLNSVIAMIGDTIFVSMDSSHGADKEAIATAVGLVAKCNADAAARIAEGGDLYALEHSAINHQEVLNGLQVDVDEKTQENATEWTALANHMSVISLAPACQEFPSHRNKPQFDNYFKDSMYVNWYNTQKDSYKPVKDTFESADAALTQAITAYDKGLGERNTGYCDYKVVLEAGCVAFNGCFLTTSSAYSETLVPALTKDMQARIEAQKGGETAISNIKLLMGFADDPAPPTFDVTRYELEFTLLPSQGPCHLETLTRDIWVPEPECL